MSSIFELVKFAMVLGVVCGNASRAAANDPPSVVWLVGDSILDRADVIVEQVARQKRRTWDVVDFGVPGQRSLEGECRVYALLRMAPQPGCETFVYPGYPASPVSEPPIPDYYPDVAVILFGANDLRWFNRDPNWPTWWPQFRPAPIAQRVMRMAQAFQAVGTAVVVATPLNLSRSARPDDVEVYFADSCTNPAASALCFERIRDYWVEQDQLRDELIERYAQVGPRYWRRLMPKLEVHDRDLMKDVAVIGVPNVLINGYVHPSPAGQIWMAKRLFNSIRVGLWSHGKR